MLARVAFFLLLIAPPIALAADAPPGAGKFTIVKPPAKTAAATPAPKAAPTLPRLAAASPAPVDPSDCRIGCANSYYLCHAGDDPDACNGGWGQCVAACSTPNLAVAPGFSTAP